MKTKIIFSLVLAIVLNISSARVSDLNTSSLGNSEYSSTMISATFLPTYIIGSDDIDLYSQEAAERLLMEARGEAEIQIAQQIADISRRPLDLVLTTALELAESTGEAAPISTVLTYLRIGVIF